MLAGLALGCSAAAAAAATDSCGSIVFTPGAAAPNLGKIVEGTQTTIFVLPNTGPPVTTGSGNAILLRPNAVTGDPIQLEVTAAPGNNTGCKIGTIEFQLSGTAGSGPQITPTGYTVSVINGSATNLSPASGIIGNPGQFSFQFTGAGDAKFSIGMSVSLAPGATGTATWSTTAAVVTP
jgi:hypothetical protein